MTKADRDLTAAPPETGFGLAYGGKSWPVRAGSFRVCRRLRSVLWLLAALGLGAVVILKQWDHKPKRINLLVHAFTLCLFLPQNLLNILH